MCNVLICYKTIIVLFVLMKSIASAQSWRKNGSYEYYIENNQVNSYTEAKDGCLNKQATLVVVKTKAVQEFLLKMNTKLTNASSTFYIGLKRNENNNFTWIDGTHLSSGYTNWMPVEPNNDGGNEYCVIMGKPNDGFVWWDAQCNITSKYICQRLTASTETSTSSKLPLTASISAFTSSFRVRTLGRTSISPSTVTIKTSTQTTLGSIATSAMTSIDSTTQSPSTLLSLTSLPDSMDDTFKFPLIGGGIVLLLIIIIIIALNVHKKNKRNKATPKNLMIDNATMNSKNENQNDLQEIYNPLYDTSTNDNINKSKGQIVDEDESIEVANVLYVGAKQDENQVSISTGKDLYTEVDLSKKKSSHVHSITPKSEAEVMNDGKITQL